jgi:hypothetical protein
MEIQFENIIHSNLRLRKPKAACFLSYVEYGPNTITSNTMKNRSHTRERVKEGC